MQIELPILDTAAVEADSSASTRVWRSLDDLNRAPAFKAWHKGEFAPGASDAPTASSRREFMKIMGAAMAMAGLSACRRPVQKILPYTRKPEEVIPGKALYYATAMPLGGVVHALLVKSHEGRPTKVEGNPDHPVSQGASGVFAQASILNLYDPDRSQRVRQNGNATSWSAFADFASGFSPVGRVAVLAEASSSPTLESLRQQFLQQFPGSTWLTYESAGDDNAALGAQLAFGQPYRTQYDFSSAGVIVSLDADFLGSGDLNAVQNARTYAEGRRVLSTQDTMSRLYVAEPAFTSTGGMADHRVRVKAGEVAGLAATLASRLGVSGITGSTSVDSAWVDAVVEDLQSNAGRSIVLAGAGQPAAVHAVCALINQALGNIGSTVKVLDTGEAQRQAQAEGLQALVSDMQAGQVDTLIMLGTNPVYSAPASLGFAEALGNVSTSIHVGPWIDETAQLCTWHIPEAHYLEAWGDGRAFDGTLSVIQPLIAPLYEDAHSKIEVLAALAGENRSGYDLVRATWQNAITGDFEAGWRLVVHDGFLENSGFDEVTTVTPQSISGALSGLPAPGGDGIEVVFRPDSKVYDGRYANNAWMQEVPDYVTKVTWDNVALLSPATAEALGLSYEIRSGQHFVDVVEITTNEGTVQLPAWISPGHADDAVTVTLGYGRELVSTRALPDVPIYDVDADIYSSGPLANGIGANVGPLRPVGGLQFVQGGQVTRVDSDYKISSTQDHGSMEGRPIVRMATLEEYRRQPTFAEQAVPLLKSHGEVLEPWDEYPALWEDQHPQNKEEFAAAKYSENQWGMVIDLNACSGCNACVVACQSENNIQVVGKNEVGYGREMSWLRLDRYYTGDDTADPGMVTMPMLCAHCENAPCESVCPVAATVHSPDGLNVMVYNRCIGTRYCANNCPYKVRRFNYYNWTKTLPTQVQMAQNPNVTVRFRGVMEKCTFCVQRIREAGHNARLENRQIQDGEVVTACQQACPSQAIAFGNLADANSQVSQLRVNDRQYELLAELSVKPRTSYMARLRNPNPRLENA